MLLSYLIRFLERDMAEGGDVELDATQCIQLRNAVQHLQRAKPTSDDPLKLGGRDPDPEDKP